MNIILLGHDDIASKVAIRLIVGQLPGHRYKLFLSGALAQGNVPLPAPLEALRRLDKSFYDVLPWGFDDHPDDLPAPNSADGVAVLRACEPDLVVSVRYRRILRPVVIQIPRHGVLNLHSGILPEYKGVMATFWAMLNGEEAIGCTLHAVVDETIDTGPTIGLSKIPVQTDRSYLANLLEQYPDGCRMMVEAVKAIAAGSTPESSRPMGKGHYYSLPRAEHLDQFSARGLRLADVGDLDAFLNRHAFARDLV